MLTVTQAAKRTGCAPGTVRWWIRHGHLPAEITPRGYRIRDGDLAAFLAKSKWTRPKRWAARDGPR